MPKAARPNQTLISLVLRSTNPCPLNADPDRSNADAEARTRSERVPIGARDVTAW